MNLRNLLRCLMALALLGAAPAVFAQAQPGLPLLTGTAGGQSYSLPVQTLVFLTSLGFLPAIILMMSSFTRIIIVLSLLRHALGTQTTPPNQVLIGLALFLSFFVMSPVLDKVYTDAYVPLRALIPAFVTSELKTAFQIGFAIFIPFLIIDIVVAAVLMSMGMMMVTPSIFSLPFKIMLFVLVDGWHLLLGSLAQSFAQ